METAITIVVWAGLICLGLWAAAFSVTPRVPQPRKMPLDVMLLLFAIVASGLTVTSVIVVGLVGMFW